MDDRYCVFKAKMDYVKKLIDDVRWTNAQDHLNRIERLLGELSEEWRGLHAEPSEARR